jgi:hypothetical protein
MSGALGSETYRRKREQDLRATISSQRQEVMDLKQKIEEAKISQTREMKSR